MEEFIHVVTADNSKTLDCAIPLGACLVKYPNEALAIKILYKDSRFEDKKILDKYNVKLFSSNSEAKNL